MLSLVAACASVPKGKYGVDALDIEGAEKLSPQAIKRCLFTLERDRVKLTLGLVQTACDEPPFDRSPPQLPLWRWPWSDWPTLNVAVMEADVLRIQRFYRARGFYDARVLEVHYEPPAAGAPSAVPTGDECNPKVESCTVRIRVVVDEGQPLHVGELRVEGLESLPRPASEMAARAELPMPGRRFDEAEYDRGKARLAEQLAEASYADVKVEGEVRLDHERKLANITYRVRTGPAYRFGAVHVEGQGALPVAPIVAAAGVKAGSAYSQRALVDAQREVYALGAFNSVELSRTLDAKRGVAELRITVVPLQRDVFRLGAGLTSGSQQRTAEGELRSVPQWDVHLTARYERRHIFSTLGKLSIEERPRLIFERPFPEPRDPSLGNILWLRLSEPGLIEARTELNLEAAWDYGPDAFRGFRRSDLALRVEAKRPSFTRKLIATLALQHDQYLVAEGTKTSDGSPVPTNYTYSFVDEELRVDLRDDKRQPRYGAYFELFASQAVRAVWSDWTLLRLVPDARVYIPLPFQMVLAARLRIGAVFIWDANQELDESSRELGPNAYRLRGGGAQGNRGFVAGELGAGREGGRRSWESSVELRMRLGGAFGIVLFYDMGDVTRSRRLSFSRPNPALGFGLRYITVVGAIRVDFGFRLGKVETASSSPLLFGTPGALHMTLGEAF